MTEFIEKPISKFPMMRRRLVHGVGINDAKYLIASTINGKKIYCPFYIRWTRMLERCYSASLHARCPTYIGCTVCDEWLLLSNFTKWMKAQSWKGKQMDKDILVQGNKVYSPATCIFVDRTINTLLTNSGAARGKHPQGVCFDKNIGEFIAQCKVKGKRNRMGSYKTAELAFDAYKKFKYALIAKIANEQTEPLRSALLRYEITGDK